MRLPFMIAGLGAAAAIVAVTTGALGDVNSALGHLAGDPGKGPLIIHIQRSTSLSQGAAGVLKQTRCLLEWTGGEHGEYDKHCSSSALPR